MKKLLPIILCLFMLLGCSSQNISSSNKISVESIKNATSREELAKLLNVEQDELDDISSALSGKLSTLVDINEDIANNNNYMSIETIEGYLGKEIKRLTIECSLDNVDEFLGVKSGVPVTEKNAWDEVTDKYEKTGYYSKLFDQGWHLVGDEEFAVEFKNGETILQGWVLFETCLENTSKEEFLTGYGIERIKGKLIFEELSNCTIVKENGETRISGDGMITPLDLDFPY